MIEFCFESINWSPYFGFSDIDVPRLIRAAGDAGFRWISFDEPLLTAYQDRGEELSSLRRLVEEQGLRTLAIHSLALGEDALDAAERCRPLAEAASTLDAPFIHVGGVAPLARPLIEATIAAAAIARAAKAKLAIEFLPFLEIDSIEASRRLLREAGAPMPGLVIDSWHFFHGPDDWTGLESLDAGEIAYVQFDDHPPLESDDLLHETTQRRVLPGKGIFDLERFAQTIRANGFDGVVGLEHLSEVDRNRPVEEVARELYAAASPYWGVEPAREPAI